MKKPPYYLICLASSRMGGGNDYTTMTEEELFKECNKWMLKEPHVTIYQPTAKSALAKKQKSIKKSELTLKEEELEVVYRLYANHCRAYRFGGPNIDADNKRKKLEAKRDQLKKEIKQLKKPKKKIGLARRNKKPDIFDLLPKKP